MRWVFFVIILCELLQFVIFEYRKREYIPQKTRPMKPIVTDVIDNKIIRATYKVYPATKNQQEGGWKYRMQKVREYKDTGAVTVTWSTGGSAVDLENISEHEWYKYKSSHTPGKRR